VVQILVKCKYVYSIKEAFLVTGREGPYGCGTTRLPHSEVRKIMAIEKSNDLIRK
jgi:hypothetical protein